jgi:predicted ATPase
MRIAITGASGTGKSALAAFLAQEYNLPVNPVGSRSVAEAMGFKSPYDVDKAGKRLEFQHKLVSEKRAWEEAHESFVVDRTTLDNLSYTIIHDIYAVTDEFLVATIGGMSRYTHVFYCPVAVFCNPGKDPVRIQNPAYHRVYDAVLEGLLRRYLAPMTRFVKLEVAGKDERRAWCREWLKNG